MSSVLELKEKTPVPQLQAGEFSLYRLRVEDYEKMVEYGIFDEDEKIELWDGILVEMSPKGTKHANAIRRISREIEKKIGEQIIFSAQDPIRLDDFSEPEPDVVLLVPPVEKYDFSHPTPKDIYLVMEIADSSIEKDRRKAANYAQNGILQYLLLNLNTNEIEDYREPSADGYRFKKTYTENESFNLVAFPDVEIKVGDLLPPKSEDEQ
jgi:Uma2 family endonuclease